MRRPSCTVKLITRSADGVKGGGLRGLFHLKEHPLASSENQFFRTRGRKPFLTYPKALS